MSPTAAVLWQAAEAEPRIECITGELTTLAKVSETVTSPIYLDEMLDLVVANGRAIGIITRDMVTGKVEKQALRQQVVQRARLFTETRATIPAHIALSGEEIRFDPEEKPGVSNLLTIYSALTGRTVKELEGEYDGRGYGDLKKDLAEVVVDFVTPFRNRTLELLEDKAELTAVLRRGEDRAREVAERTLADVYDRVGFVPVGG